MNNRFDDFIDKIPSNISNNTRTFIGENIAVFIPDTFVAERKITMKDYHFIVFHTTPPICIIDDKEIHFKKGRLICMAPGTEILVKPHKYKSPIKYIALSIKKDYFENLLIKISGTKDIEFKKIENYYSYKLLDFIEFFIQEFIYLGELSLPMIESIETQIVIQLLRDSDLDPITHKIDQFQTTNYVRQAIKYIEDYYSSNITINEICNALYISPCHFQRIFKKTVKKTPYQYIMEYRIKKAKELLMEEKTSIAEIARLCGFLSSGHFSTVFKKNEGKTPSQYRNSLKQSV